MQTIKTIKFVSGQIAETPNGEFNIIRDRRSSFIWLYRGQKKVCGGLVDIIEGVETFTTRNGYVIKASVEEEIFCTDPAVLPIDRAFKGFLMGAWYVIEGVKYPKEAFIGF